MLRPPVAPRYMSRFQCIAERCEATWGNPEEGWGFHASAVRATALRRLRLPELPLTSPLTPRRHLFRARPMRET